MDKIKEELKKQEEITIDKVAHALIAIAREIVRKEDENKKVSKMYLL